MRIGWATPFSNRSAIGQISKLVTDALTSRGHDVVIIRTEEEIGVDDPIQTTCRIAWWKREDFVSFQRDFDAIVVNIGDQYAYHAGALELVQNLPCLGIFHDFYLYNLFCGWLASGAGRLEHHDEEIRRVYGDHVPARLHGAHDLAGIQRIAENTPMTEWVAKKCAAAVAHSQFYAGRLERSCPGPVALAQLPARDIPAMPYLPAASRFIVTTIGIINPNKCADTVIKALSQLPELQHKAEYRLVGTISEAERTRLEQTARSVGFNNLNILGTVDDATLYAEIEAADVLCCLRSPVLEGASASAIESLKAGRAVVVANAGFYADLPDEFVQKVTNVTPEELSPVLQRLYTDTDLRLKMAIGGREWAQRTFDADSYAQSVEQIAQDMINLRPLHLLSRRIGQNLASLGVAHDDPHLDVLAAKMSDLFGRLVADSEKVPS